MYELQNSTATKRTYRSSITGTEVTTSLIHTSQSGDKWWAFDDLLNIPFIRKKTAENLTRLYGAGIVKEDLLEVVKKLKDLLKSSDSEKYEKSYAEVLQLEQMADKVMDPIKQSLSLCPVYILAEDERIDTFNSAEAKTKMEKWALDPDAQAFFLNWLNDGMNAYLSLSNTISQIASTQTAK